MTTFATVNDHRNVELWLVSADDDNGTWSAAFATEDAAYDHIFECIGKERREFEASGQDIWDFINANVVNPDMDTYNVSFDEVALPPITDEQAKAISLARQYVQAPQIVNPPSPDQANTILAALGQPVDHPAEFSFEVTLYVRDIQVEAENDADATRYAQNDLDDPALAGNWTYEHVSAEETDGEFLRCMEPTIQNTSVHLQATDDGLFTFDGHIEVTVDASSPEQAFERAIEMFKRA